MQQKGGRSNEAQRGWTAIMFWNAHDKRIKQERFRSLSNNYETMNTQDKKCVLFT